MNIGLHSEVTWEISLLLKFLKNYSIFKISSAFHYGHSLAGHDRFLGQGVMPSPQEWSTYWRILPKTVLINFK